MADAEKGQNPAVQPPPTAASTSAPGGEGDVSGSETQCESGEITDVEPSRAASATTALGLERHGTKSERRTSDDDDDDSASDFGPVPTAASSEFAAAHMSRGHEVLFVATVCCAQLTTQAGLGQTLPIMHLLGAQFGLDGAGDLAWFMAAYSLTVGSFILVSGRLGDLFGHKRMLIIGFLWFALWSLVAGLAAYSNYVLFNFARALQGIGPSILLPNGLAILGSSYPPGDRKNMVFACFGAAAPGGSMLGAVFGALFGTHAWWPWAFWSFALALIGLATLAHFVIPEPPVEPQMRHSLRTKLAEIDVPGAAVGITALVLINIAWNQAPTAGWSEPYVYVLLLLGALLVPLFFWIELRVAPKPLLPLDALRSADIAFVLGCLGCGWGCFGIWYYYIWQFYLEIRDVTPLLAVAYVCPVAVSGAVAAIVTGHVLGRIGPAWTMNCALTAFLAGICLVAFMPAEQTYWANGFVTTLVATWGMDMSFPAATVILSNAVHKKHQGIGASLVNTVVNYSISLALGFAGTAEAYLNHGGQTKADKLVGYRAALYVGIGIAGLGWALSVMFLVFGYVKRGKREATPRT